MCKLQMVVVDFQSTNWIIDTANKLYPTNNLILVMLSNYVNSLCIYKVCLVDQELMGIIFSNKNSFISANDKF